MSTQEFAVASVDALVFRLDKDGLKVYLHQRRAEPFEGVFALPGVLIRHRESIEDATRRAVKVRSGVSDALVGDTQQFKVFDEPERDPRGNTLSIASFVAVDENFEAEASDGGFFPVENLPALAFDHEDVVAAAVPEIVRSPFAVRALLGEQFTTGDLLHLFNACGQEVDATNLSRMVPVMLPVQRVGRKASRFTGRSSLLWSFA